jgi:hypothetical protein
VARHANLEETRGDDVHGVAWISLVDHHGSLSKYLHHRQLGQRRELPGGHLLEEWNRSEEGPVRALHARRDFHSQQPASTAMQMSGAHGAVAFFSIIPLAAPFPSWAE